MNNQYLYCFGGLSRNEQNQAFLNGSIEVLDLKNLDAGWEKLSLTLPITGCDIGCLPVNKDEVLVFGGWNKSALKGAYIFSRKTNNFQSSLSDARFYGGSSKITHDVKTLPGGSCLDQADFFLVNGIAMQSPNPRKVRICGHT
jgi:hypothetical protein